jgi:VacB/RNase II family 3'-5' exoribonuclease
MSFPSPSRSHLEIIARRVMQERGLAPDFPPAALAEVAALAVCAPSPDPAARDLRRLSWCSIDNEESRDLDQLSVAEALPGGAVRVLIAIADVDAFVAQGSAIDAYAEQNTTSVYTTAKVFPMLPQQLSTDLTSLNFAEDRRAMVVEITVTAEGHLTRSDVYRALVHNHARLNYSDVAGWLEGTNAAPPALDAVAGLAENLRLQDRVARQLRLQRHAAGALTFETTQARPVFSGGELTDLAIEKPNRAKQLIEDFMITANGVTARFLAARNYASIRRVVRTPRRWDRIGEIAAERGATLPVAPDAKALDQFLNAEKARDPAQFADLSLSVIKLLGAGEYALEVPGSAPAGHFGLAVRDYAHSTAPNRRFPDLITQRLLKAALRQKPSPYAHAKLEALAAHCTEQEDDARKVERQVGKSAAAMLLSRRIGEEFEAMVTGAGEKGTWVRLFRLPSEGKLVRGFERRQVGDKLRVKLVQADVERGFLDFVAV